MWHGSCLHYGMPLAWADSIVLACRLHGAKQYACPGADVVPWCRKLCPGVTPHSVLMWCRGAVCYTNSRHRKASVSGWLVRWCGVLLESFR